MEKTMVLPQILPAAGSKPQELLREAIKLLVKNGSPSLKLWLLASERPTTGETNVEEIIEKGVLHLGISVPDPVSLVPEAEKNSFVFRKMLLGLWDRKAGNLLCSSAGEEAAPVFRFRLLLTKAECLAARRAIENKPSSLHLKGSLFYRAAGREMEARLLFPLRNIISQQWPVIDNQAKKNCMELLWFDVMSARYQPAPVFITNRPNAGRDIQRASAKLLPQNKWLVNPALLVQPSSQAPTPQNHVGVALNTKNKLLYFDDILVKPAGEKKPSLPLVNDAGDAAWPDAAEQGKFWYLPEYHLIEPKQTHTTSTSPFLLSFTRIGADAAGVPVLRGFIRLRLSAAVPAAAITIATNTGAKLNPVVIVNQSFQLDLPFTDTNETLRHTTIPASQVSNRGNEVELEFQLTNDWIRNCYGVLSVPGFQPVSAALKIYTAFRGLSPAEKHHFQLLAQPAFLKLELAKKAVPGRAVFNISSRSLQMDDQELRFRDSTGERATLTKSTALVKASMLSKAAVTGAIVAKPSAVLPQATEKAPLAERSFGSEQRADVFFPCAQFGQFYIEESATGETNAVGCYEPYRIGEIKFRLYELLPSLTTPFYKVHRSLQCPNRFLVEPVTYRITRFSSSMGDKAYKACVHMYGAIDQSDQLEQSVCVLDLSMDPDIPAGSWYRLQQELAQQANTQPVVEFPGEVMKDVVFNWSLPAGTQAQTLNLGRTVQLTVTVPIMQALTLEAMLQDGVLNGQAVYTMEDSSEFLVKLQPDSSHIAGPWNEGPLAVIRGGGTVTFENKTERDIELLRVTAVDTSADTSERHEINYTLPPGGTQQLPAPVPGLLYLQECTSDSGPVPLEQSWVFIDDLSCQVIFSTDIDFATHQLSAIEVEMSFSDAPPKVLHGRLTPETPAAEFESFIPLLRIGGARNISYRTRNIEGDAPGNFSDWQQWSVKDQGSIVNLTSEILFNN